MEIRRTSANLVFVNGEAALIWRSTHYDIDGVVEIVTDPLRRRFSVVGRHEY